MSYMQAYKQALIKARNKSNGGEMSELEKEDIRIGLGVDSREGMHNSADDVADSLGVGTKSGIVSDK